MGMFDEIKVEYPLPDPEVQDHIFQTKDLLNMLDRFTLTREGRLIWHKTRTEDVPEEERPYWGKTEWVNPLFQMIGSVRSIPVADIDYQYHGHLRFYTSTGDINKSNFTWYEYEAAFTNGALVEIKRVRGRHGNG